MEAEADNPAGKNNDMDVYLSLYLCIYAALVLPHFLIQLILLLLHGTLCNVRYRETRKTTGEGRRG